MASLQIKRGLRSQLDAAATASGLKIGELYLITDEDRLAIGTAINAYQVVGKADDFATAAQGTLADTAVQPGDNISTLTNDSGYLTSNTIGIVFDGGDSAVSSYPITINLGGSV